MSTWSTTGRLTDIQLLGEPQVALLAPRSLLSISQQPQSHSMTSIPGHFTGMSLSGEPPSAQQAPRSLLSISRQPQYLSMASVTGHFDGMRSLDEASIASLQRDNAEIPTSHVREEDPPHLTLWCSEGADQCHWHFFYIPGTPWSIISRIVSGHHHFCPMTPFNLQPEPSTTSPRRTRSMTKLQTSDIQQKVGTAKASRKTKEERPVEDPVGVIPHLRPLTIYPKFPEYDLADNEHMDPRQEGEKDAEYEALFRPHCGGPPYILDIGDAEVQFKGVHQSQSTGVAESLVQEFPLWPAIW
ncbi:uncharacterized protein BT62DRAFT_923176 [Guyanagaster necrorhizus]|uniref:Uncharacterized protein n=1 Tax=Guyanagaster necrorhizus TaxID=856835 RepID=A0A9P7VIA5_9AGAR|nr:uncharacterized protein BT62DRAFT_923176 [Guyanagaster necrorhizus MCA 3950]KAG7441571.1 hypothetical protein BT62DRAFT_923176 [Guyanagaster necrorhizus MCA 3950]